MKRILLILTLLAVSVFGKSEKEIVDYLNNLNMNQRMFLKETYYGAKERGYGAILSGIAMRESEFNENRINLNDGKDTRFPGSYSGYQIHLNSYVQVKRLSREEAGRELQKIMDNPEYARKIAMDMLDEWKAMYKKQGSSDTEFWMLASYNGGTRVSKNSDAKAYAKDVQLCAKVIDKYMKDAEASRVLVYKKTTINKS
jgi:hypothetical protein